MHSARVLTLSFFAIFALTLSIGCGEPGFDYGANKYPIKRLEESLRKSPCDLTQFAELLELMHQSGDTLGVGAKQTAFKAKCQRLPFMPWLTHAYGPSLTEVRGLSAALDAEPCDAKKTVKLLDKMVGAGDYRTVLTRADAYFQACGDLPRARWLTFAAHKNLREYDKAVAEATRLIDSDPYDRDFWWWRADAQYLGGQYLLAISDYQKVIELCSKCKVGWQLADAFEKLNRPCDAIAPLQKLLADHPGLSDEDKIRARTRDLAALPACGAAQH